MGSAVAQLSSLGIEINPSEEWRGGETFHRAEAARRYRRVAVSIALTDALALDVAILLVRLTRFGLKPPGLGFAGLLLVGPAVWVGMFAMFHAYALSRSSPVEEFRRILEASGVAAAVKLATTLLFGQGALSALSRGWLILTWALAVLMVLGGRHFWHKRIRRLRADGVLAFRTAILGANEEAVRIAEALRPKARGFIPIGLVHTGNGPLPPADGLPILGRIDELTEVIESNEIECIFVASSAVSPDVMKRLSKHVRRSEVEVRVSANLADILASRLSVQPVGDLLALCLRPVRLTGPQASVKRTFDLIVAGLAVLLTCPLWLASAILIRLSSRGPVFFKQVRVGREGRPFTIYKFRTMLLGAELLLATLEGRNEASGPLFKIRDDPRVTKVGKWLRRWSFDELPQLLNVLKGDMSLVGPRPPLPKEVATYEDWHRDRLEVRPGITGPWQVGGRSELTFDDYVRLDLFYIENWSLTYDLFILAKTLPAVLYSKGAY